MRATRAIRATKTTLEPRIDPNLGTRRVQPQSPSCIRWSSIELLNEVFEALLGVAEALLGVAKPRIKA